MSWIELVAQRRPPQIPKGVTPPENAADWFRIENAAEDSDTTEVFVYDMIGGWSGMYADEFIDALREVTTKNISLRLNSPGGSVFEGIAIANAIRSHPANVTIYVDGLAASIASIIALAGDQLVMKPSTQLMIHDASGACYGNATDMEYMVGLLHKQSDNIAEAYADRAGGPPAEWRDRMKAETWYTAKEAVAAGLANELWEPPKKGDEANEEDVTVVTEDSVRPLATLMNQTWDLTAYHYEGRDSAPDPVLPEKPETKETVASAPETVEIKLDFIHFTDELLDFLHQAIRTRDAAEIQDTAADDDVTDDPAETRDTDDADDPMEIADPDIAPPEPEPVVDDWQNAIAGLLDTPPSTSDDWNALVAGLTAPPSSAGDA